MIMFDRSDPAAVAEADRLSSFMVHKVQNSIGWILGTTFILND